MERTAEVIILGAGAAGLVAAATLRDAGVRVRLLEARARTGGRILTVREQGLDGPLELGAEFVHGEAPLTRRLLAEAGAACEPVAAASWERRGGRLVPSGTWERIERVLARLGSEGGPDRSFAEFLRAQQDIDPEDAAAALAFVEGFYAADAQSIGEQALAAEGGAGGALDSLRVPAGYDRLVHGIERDLPIRLGHAVTRVEWRPGRVVVHGELTGRDARFEPLLAEALVLTVPLGVLAAPEGSPGWLRLEPAVALLDEARDRLAMGHAKRLVLVLSRPVEEALGFRGFLHVPTESPHVFWTLEPTSERALVAWSGGPRALGLPSGGDALLARTLKVLSRATGVPGAELERLVTAARWHDWSADPWSRGAYAYPLVGGDDAADALCEPVAGTLFTAGEATSREAMGTVEGALASGLRAAGQVLEALGGRGA